LSGLKPCGTGYGERSYNVKSDGTNQKAIAYLYETVINPENVVFLSYFSALK
jgi:hypothetical protein